MKKLTRLAALIVKEFLVLFRDPKGWVVLVIPPLLQLFIFAFVATLEVKNIHVVVMNADRGKHGTEIVHQLQASSTISKVTFVNRMNDISTLVDNQKAIAAIYIPQDFSKNIESGMVPAKVQVILDGRKSNAAQIVNGYINELVGSYGQKLQGDTSYMGMSTVQPRNWFNANLNYLWFTVSSLIGLLALLITVTVTALSVARERELGTFEQLLVSPLMPHEILIGKAVPAIIIGMFEGLLIVVAAIFIFGITLTGSFLLLTIALFIFIMSIVGVGLFISSISKTQQQSILGTFVFMVPAIILSGYASPVENMPEWLQLLNQGNPLKHFLITAKGLFLKDMPASDVWDNTWPLLIIGTTTLAIAGYFFRRRLN